MKKRITTTLNEVDQKEFGYRYVVDVWRTKGSHSCECFRTLGEAIEYQKMIEGQNE